MNNKLLLEKVINFNKKNELIKSNDKIIVGLSGGPDSIALLCILIELKNIFSLKLMAVHLNHHLRGKDSEKDEKFVKQFCKEKDIPVIIKNFDVTSYAKKNRLGLEEAGRIVRYKLFESLLKKYNFTKIALGHNSNDNIETIIFNFVRGTGIKGLVGIRCKRDNIIRPILCLSRNEIESYLKDNRINYVTDSSNYDINFNRNFIRHKIVPLLRDLNPEIVQNSLYFSERMKEVDVLIENLSKDYNKYFKYKNHTIVIEIFNNKDYFNILFKLLLQKKLYLHYNVISDYDDVEKVLSLIKMSKGKCIYLKENLIGIRESKNIIIKKNNANKEIKIDVKVNRIIKNEHFYFKMTRATKYNINNNSNIEFIDADKIDGKLTLRNWTYGDKIVPFGATSPKKVKEVITNKKILNSIRKNILVLSDKSNIIWLCGISLSNDYRITESTKNIIKLEVKYNFELS